MEINITLHGILRDNLPRQAKGKTTLTLPDNSTVAEAVRQLNITRSVSAAVNGTEVELDHVLQDGEELQLFQLIGGG